MSRKTVHKTCANTLAGQTLHAPTVIQAICKWMQNIQSTLGSYSVANTVGLLYADVIQLNDYLELHLPAYVHYTPQFI